MSDTDVTIPASWAAMFLRTMWVSQWETRYAAENTVCAYNCGEPYEDFSGHSVECEFVSHWSQFVDLVAQLGMEKEFVIRFRL
jgi:hypothetical protein